MTKAARRAGVPSCTLVYEPECAAVHAVITQLQPLDPLEGSGFLHVGRSFPEQASVLTILQAGDVIMVADLGGGTAGMATSSVLHRVEC